MLQSLSHAQVFVTPWTAGHQASLSSTESWSLPKLMSIESVMPSNHLIFCHPRLLAPSIFQFVQMSPFFTSGGQNIGVSEVRAEYKTVYSVTHPQTDPPALDGRLVWIRLFWAFRADTARVHLCPVGGNWPSVNRSQYTFRQ